MPGTRGVWDSHILVTFVHVLPDGRRRGGALAPGRVREIRAAAGASETEALSWRPDGTGGPRSAVERFRLRGRTGAAGARGQGVSSVRSATSDVGARPAEARRVRCGVTVDATRPRGDRQRGGVRVRP